MSAERGLEPRYRVEKVSDPTGKHDDCRYFVLDPQHDPTAREALTYYASRTPNRALARDLNDWLDALGGDEMDADIWTRCSDCPHVKHSRRCTHQVRGMDDLYRSCGCVTSPNSGTSGGAS